ncbi:MAG: hypothetical protein LUH53_07920 [Lachnospiraceae bacterium]|nr:hypothetical protein [Lachnospiraceae bacterium]
MADASGTAAQTDLSLTTVSDIPDQTWTGSAISPAVTITYENGTITLIQGTDYVVTYSKNTDVGTASVTITGTGSYSGTIEKTFRINPQPTTLTALTAYCNGFKATWTKVSAQTTGYQVQYSSSSTFAEDSTGTLSISDPSTVSKSITVANANTTYYVRVRTYKTVNGQEYCSAWSNTKSLKTGGIVTKSNGKKYYKYDSGSYAKSKFVTISGKTYYFDSKGVMTTGWAKISGSYYFFNRSTGVQQKSTTVDGIKLKSNGKATVNSSKKTFINTMITARKYMLANTKPTDSKATKLKKCFNWVLKHPYKRYRRLAEVRSTKNWICTYANDVFKKGNGCCVSEACAFAFMAHECGYTAYVCDDTGHAWTEINGKVYDTLFAEAKSFSKYYGSTYKTAGLHRSNKTRLRAS